MVGGKVMGRDDTVKRATLPNPPTPLLPIPCNLSSNTNWILDNPFMNSVIEKPLVLSGKMMS